MSNFFGDVGLNRVSFLREDTEFIKLAFTSSEAKFIVFVNGEAFYDISSDGTPQLHIETSTSLKGIITTLSPLLETKDLRVDVSGVSITFLGLDDRIDGFSYKGKYKGAPYFGLEFKVDDKTLLTPKDIEFTTSLQRINRESLFMIDNHSATLYSHAKMYLDWLNKYKFCPGCGSVIYPVHGGTKLQCSSAPEVNCNVRNARVNNVCFPRSDPVIIIAMANEDYSKICLARSFRKHGNFVMYSTIAGFMEPGESIENACAREIWEEAGVHCDVDNVKIISSQPWPYPANLMIGCLGIVKFNNKDEIIDLGNDPELMDAQWFDTNEVRAAMDSYKTGWLVPFKDEINFPGETAIAHHLIRHVCKQHQRLQKL